jgi:hypothetical protein
MKIQMVLGTAGLLALAACGGGDGGKTAADNGASEAASSEGGSAASAGGAGGSDVKLRPGQWEMHAEVEMPGMPKEAADMMKGTVTTTKTCISEQDVQRSDANIFTGKKDSNCKTEGFEAKNGRIKGTVTCTGDAGQGKMKMEMEGSFRPDSYEVRSKMDVEGVGGEGMKMETHVTAKRIGDCPAGGKG